MQCYPGQSFRACELVKQFKVQLAGQQVIAYAHTPHRGALAALQCHPNPLLLLKPVLIPVIKAAGTDAEPVARKGSAVRA
jgi:hypothetical protein